MRTHSLLAFAACFLFSRAEPIAAFYTGGGPVMVSLDPAGNFLYNVHSKTGFSDMKTFTPTIPPKNGTSIACVGYGSSSIYVCPDFYLRMNANEARVLYSIKLPITVLHTKFSSALTPRETVLIMEVTWFQETLHFRFDLVLV